MQLFLIDLQLFFFFSFHTVFYKLDSRNSANLIRAHPTRSSVSLTLQVLWMFIYNLIQIRLCQRRVYRPVSDTNRSDIVNVSDVTHISRECFKTIWMNTKHKTIWMNTKKFCTSAQLLTEHRKSIGFNKEMVHHLGAIIASILLGWVWNLAQDFRVCLWEFLPWGQAMMLDEKA